MKGLGRLHSRDAGASPALLLRMDAVARDPILLVGPGLVGPPVVGKITAAVPRPDLVLSDDE